METEFFQDWVGAQATAAELLRQQACREPFHALTPPFAIQTLEQAYASQDAFVQQQASQRKHAGRRLQNRHHHTGHAKLCGL
jgi:2-keto-4-pentenoate hydratase